MGKMSIRKLGKIHESNGFSCHHFFQECIDRFLIQAKLEKILNFPKGLIQIESKLDLFLVCYLLVSCRKGLTSLRVIKSRASKVTNPKDFVIRKDAKWLSLVLSIPTYIMREFLPSPNSMIPDIFQRLSSLT